MLVVAAGQEIVDGPVVPAVETGLAVLMVGRKLAVADGLLVAISTSLNQKENEIRKKLSIHLRNPSSHCVWNR